MHWRRRKERAYRPGPAALRRRFVTPEGVDLQIELGSRGARAGAFLLDGLVILGVLIAMTILIGWLALSARSGAMIAVWLIGFFVLRNGWFVLFEMGGRGATPGKRAMGLRVVARDGARLTGGAVIARNAMREIEIFLPLTFLFTRTSEGAASTLVVLLSLAWSGIFAFLPVFNRDRLRVGDLVAGTWVVRAQRGALAGDLAAEAVRTRQSFSDAALDLYGEYELQALEQVLRIGDDSAMVIVAATIRRKAGLPDEGGDRAFLADYYAALCARLERGMLVGRRRADKFAAPGRRAA